MSTQGLPIAALVSTMLLGNAPAQDLTAVLSAGREFAASPVEDFEARLAELAGGWGTVVRGAEWDSVRDSLERAGLEPLPEEGDSAGNPGRTLLLRDTALGNGAPKADLFLRLPLSESHDAATYLVNPSLTVGDPSVGLRFDSLRSIELGSLEDSFPETSLIGEALRSWAVAETRVANPLPDRIEFTCGRFATRAIGEPTPSFLVRLTFVKSQDESARGVQLTCRADCAPTSDSTRIDPQSWRRREFVPPSDIETLPTDLRSLLTSGEKSYQRILQRATRLAQRVTSNRDWDEVESALARLGLKPITGGRGHKH